MDVASCSRSQVQERLSRLDAEFGPLEVTQATFEVAPEQYLRALERSRDGWLGVRVVVRDDDGAVLVGEDDRGWLAPRDRRQPDQQFSAAVRHLVRESAGVDCVVTDATSADIRGIRNSDDESAATLYRLDIVFVAEAPAIETLGTESCGRTPSADPSRRHR